MKRTIHLLKNDLAHFRGWLLLLYAVAGVRMTALAIGVRTGGTSDGAEFTCNMLLVAEIVLVVVTVVRAVHADAMTGTSAFWLTHPVSRRDMWLAKTSFFAGTILGPLVAVQATAGRLFAFSAVQNAQSVLALLLYATAVVFVAAALASVTADLGRFALGAALLGLAFLGTFLLIELARHKLGWGWQRSGPMSWSAQQSTVALVVASFAGSGMLAWTWQALTRRCVGGITILGAGIVAAVTVCHAPKVDFLATERAQPAGLGISLVDAHDEPDGLPGQQVLWSHFSVKGLPPNHVAAADELYASFVPDRGPGLTAEVNHRRHYRSTELLRHGMQGGPECVDMIKDRFPRATMWYGDTDVSSGSRLPVNGQIPRIYGNGPVKGTMSGFLHVTIVDMRKVAELSLQAGSEALLGAGERLRVRSSRVTASGVSLSLTRTVPCLLFSRDDRTRFMGPIYRGTSHLFFVLHHPGSGEASMVNSENSRWPAVVHPLDSVAIAGWQVDVPYRALQARLGGLSPDEWLAEARLSVFRAVEVGEYDYGFREANYDFVLDRGWREPGRTPTKQRRQTDEALPDDPMAVGVERYVELVLEHMVKTGNHQERMSMAGRLDAIGPDVVPAILRLAPIGESRAYYPLKQVLHRLVSREHIPELREALPRDMRLAELALQRKWGTEVRDIVLAELPKRLPRLTTEALIIAAHAKDPATYDDLAWYVVHARSGQERLLAALAECPGFDTSSSVRLAWRRARLGMISNAELIVPAAGEGIEEAFDLAIGRFEDEANANAREKHLTELASLVRYTGEQGGLGDWLRENRGRFVYDEHTRLYVLR